MSAPVTSVTSRDNPLLVRVRKLARGGSAYRREGALWLEGEHLCAAWRAHGGGDRAQAVISESAWETPGLRELALASARAARVSDALFASVSDLESPAGIGFVVPSPEAPPIEPTAATVVLDRVQDAGNVGSILRSASAMGFAQILSIEGTAALWSPKVLRAGMGAHFALRLIEGQDAAALACLDVPLLAASSHAVVSIDEAALPWPCAWVFAHEGQGVASDVLVRCTQMLRIPQPGGEESLNVAAAAAVCLYATRRGAR
jgi:TrmH family RNA methyltransferase